MPLKAGLPDSSSIGLARSLRFCRWATGRVGLTMAQLKDTAQTGRRQDMRVMLMIKGDPEPGAAPSEELLAAMGRYNAELKEAGGAPRPLGALPERRGEAG
jgi:hypothetical protein